MIMSTTWILIANSSKANLYSTHKARLFKSNGQDDDCLQLIKQFTHDASRQKITADMVSDRLGNDNRGSMLGGHGTYAEPSDPKAVEANRFAHELAEELDTGRVSGQYDDLYIFANPPFHGLLNKHLNNHLSSLISRVVEKDYTHLSGRQLRQQLQVHL